MSAHQLVHDFDEAAQWWGWERDHGTGTFVTRAMEGYNASKEALTSYVLDMEATLAMIEMHKDKV